MLSSGSPHVGTAVFQHVLGLRLETIRQNAVTIWKCQVFEPWLAVAKYQLPTAVWSRMPSYLLISLLVQTLGPFCSLQCSNFMCRHVAYLLWPLLSLWPSIDTARRREGEFEMYHKIRLMLIKLSSCICFCSGICYWMFFTGNSLSCDFYSCCCKTSPPRSDIGSEALRSIAVTPYVPICQAAPTRWYSLPSHSWSNCLLHLGLWPRHKCWCQHWLPLFSTQNAFTWSPLLWVTECECFWKGAGHRGCGGIVMVSGPPIFSTNSPKGINVGTFSCGGAVMSSSEHWQCTGWKRSCLRGA